MRYKVIEIKKQTVFKGRMKVEHLEEKINEFAKVGWELDRIISGESSFLGKDTFVLIFKQETI